MRNALSRQGSKRGRGIHNPSGFHDIFVEGHRRSRAPGSGKLYRGAPFRRAISAPAARSASRTTDMDRAEVWFQLLLLLLLVLASRRWSMSRCSARIGDHTACPNPLSPAGARELIAENSDLPIGQVWETERGQGGNGGTWVYGPLAMGCIGALPCANAHHRGGQTSALWDGSMITPKSSWARSPGPF